MQLKEFFPGLLNHKAAEGSVPKTIQEYTRFLNKVLGPSIGDIELQDFRKTHADLVKMEGRNYGVHGSERGIVVLRQLLQYIKDAGFELLVDWRDIHVPMVVDKEVDWLTPEEWEQVRNAFNLDNIVGLRDRTMVEVLWATGMRIGEALSLNRDTLNYETKEATIKGGKRPYKERKVYFTDDSIYWIKQYLAMRNEKFPPLFVNLMGERLPAGSARRSMVEAMHKAGIKKRIHPHIFRSTHATNLLEGGANIKAVQYLLGHESERTTLRHYAAVNKSHAKEEHQRILNKKGEVTEIDFVKELVWHKKRD